MANKKQKPKGPKNIVAQAATKMKTQVIPNKKAGKPKKRK